MVMNATPRCICPEQIYWTLLKFFQMKKNNFRKYLMKTSKLEKNLAGEATQNLGGGKANNKRGTTHSGGQHTPVWPGNSSRRASGAGAARCPPRQPPSQTCPRPQGWAHPPSKKQASRYGSKHWYLPSLMHTCEIGNLHVICCHIILHNI